MTEALLQLTVQLPILASNAGLFVSRGQGTHPDRVINSFELIFVKEGVLGLAEEDQDFEVQAGETLSTSRLHFRISASLQFCHFGGRYVVPTPVGRKCFRKKL